jgi:hypothetical protein
MSLTKRPACEARARLGRDDQKKLKALERKIARLDDEKRAVNEQL